MPFANPADRRAWAKTYRGPNHEAHLAYDRNYAKIRRDKRRARGRAWYLANIERAKALDRLRFLRGKKELSAGEIAQCAEICKIYPKKRICYGRES